MKHRLLRILALLLVLALLLPLSPLPARAEEGDDLSKTTYDEGTGYSVEYEKEAEDGDDFVTSELVITADPDSLLDQMEPPAEADPFAPSEAQSSGAGSGVLSGPSSQMPKQLTMDDIQAMNPGATVIDIYTNEGYLSTLVGKYYAEKVENVEDGVKSIQGMAALLGLSKGCDFFAVYSETNNTGYTFYTYQQRYGGVMAPEDRYGSVFADLLACLGSIRFTEEYVRASQRTNFPLASTPVRTENLEFLCKVHATLLQKYAQ